MVLMPSPVIRLGADVVCGCGVALTARLIVVDPVCPCASVAETGGLTVPGGVDGATVARNENTLSPAVTSPCVPSSKNVWGFAPPMPERSTVTACPLELAHDGTFSATVSSGEHPAYALVGCDAPMGANGLATVRGIVVLAVCPC